MQVSRRCDYTKANVAPRCGYNDQSMSASTIEGSCGSFAMIAAGPRSRKMEFPMNRTRYSRRDVKDDAVAVEAQAEEIKARYTKYFGV